MGALFTKSKHSASVVAKADGSVAFSLDEVLPASAAYRWTLNHTVGVDDPMELFPCRVVTIGA